MGAAVLSLVLGLAVILPSVLLLVNTSTWHHVNKSIQRWLVENHWDRQIVAGHPNCCPLLPLVGRPSRAFAGRSRPLLGPPRPLLPPSSPRGNAPPPSPPRSLALLRYDPARRDGRHLRLLDLPLLFRRPPCCRHLSRCRRTFSGPVDILVAWGEKALQAAGCGWLQASHGSAGAFTACSSWLPSTAPASSPSSTGKTASTSHGRGVMGGF